ncbi:MAG: M15 family metallopeptidase [Labilithrix sp.]|nr:M15 family metallopeptidase [Labilithrix sp.]
MVAPRTFLSALAALTTTVLVAGCASEIDEPASSTEAALCTTACTSGTLDGDALLTRVDRSSALRSTWAPITSALPAGYALNAQSLREDARAGFIALVDAARRDGVSLACLSGYRSFQTQCALFRSYADRDGCDAANTYSANAGHSEHQLGTVCDMALARAGSSFIEAGGPADQWLRAHAHQYGFACSYPNADRRNNDGYIHEPWHYRYIGPRAATELKAREARLAGGLRLAVPVFIASLSASERDELELSGESNDGAEEQETGPDAGSSSGGASPAAPDCSTVPFEGRCTGTVLEWCASGTYRRADCAERTDGRVACGEDPSPHIGKNCIRP